MNIRGICLGKSGLPLIFTKSVFVRIFDFFYIIEDIVGYKIGLRLSDSSEFFDCLSNNILGLLGCRAQFHIWVLSIFLGK